MKRGYFAPIFSKISKRQIFNLGARKGGDVHFLIARLYITVLD